MTALDSSIFYTSARSALFSSHRIRFIQTCALGGVSLAPYASCNIAYHVGDAAESVRQNRTQILRHFGGKPLLYCDQIHSTILADSASDLKPLLRGEMKADGIICADSAYVALTMVADCNPILLYDPKQHIFALLHAGRAGVCGRILTHGVEALHAKGSSPADLLVFIGSSIRACCYEIGRELCETIARDFGDGYIHTKTTPSGDIYMLNMIAMLADECGRAGVIAQNVEILDSCAACDERLFSYRRACQEQSGISQSAIHQAPLGGAPGRTGRFGLFVSLLEA